MKNNWIMPICAALNLFSCALPLDTHAELEIVSDVEPQSVFAGQTNKIPVVFHNSGDQIFNDEVRTRILQASSATAIRLGEASWKKLEVLAGQTVIESASLNFPAVKSETRFLVQWLEGTNKVVGITEVFVYPTNLLEQLKPLAGESETGLGVLDPSKQLKPLLKKLAVKFVDFEETDLDLFSGKLAIVGPCDPGDSEGTGLGGRIGRLAKKGVAVVWIQSPPRKRARVWPSFYSAQENQAAVIVVQPALIADLSGNPQSQLNLIYFCQLALHPQPPALPDLAPQPQVKL
jgi:hypothetical protein